VRPKHLERQLSAEIEFHIESRTRDLVKLGVPEAEARRRVRVEFGGTESVKDDCRDVRRGQFIQELLKDLHYALRVFRKTPAFSLAAICTLAIGIGACTSIFTVVDDVLLRPLSYPEPDRLVKPLTKNPPLGIKNGPTSLQDYQDWRESGVFESVGIYVTDNAVLSTGGQSERVIAATATDGVLSALKVKPLAGRIFTAGESKPSLTPVVLLTERTWRRRFGADPKLLGGAIKLNGLSLTVVGILPAGFTFEGDPELWMSPIVTGDETSRENRYWTALARLLPGATRAQTGAQLGQISRRLAAAYPASNRDWGVDLVGLKDDLVGDTRAQLLVLLGAVGCVWLIVCANIATLLLVRASGRGREMAARAALGASGARLVRQLATESLVLVLAGGAAGVGMALAAVSLLREYGPADLPRLDQIHVDAISVAFTLGIATLTGAVQPGARVPDAQTSSRRGLAGRRT
jgi:predicted permease